MGCLLRVSVTQHTYCSHHARLIVLSLFLHAPRKKREFERCGEVWVEGNGDGKSSKRKKEKRMEEALNQETERDHDTKTRSRAPGPPGFEVYV